MNTSLHTEVVTTETHKVIVELDLEEAKKLLAFLGQTSIVTVEDVMKDASSSYANGDINDVIYDLYSTTIKAVREATGPGYYPDEY